MSSLNLRRLPSFFTFDLPVNYSHIYSRFRKTHDRQRSNYASWPATATRRQLINEYWNHAVWHYLLLFGVAAVAVLFLSGQLNASYVLTSMTLGIAAYLPLYFIVYRPTFTGDFLPKLETALATHEGHERAWLEKCKQDQLTNRALVLLFYVFDKTSKINYLGPNDKCADLLHKIFGSSPDGIKKALDLIHKEDKRGKLEPRHRVEVSKSFEEAFAILEAMQFKEGVKLLKQLEQDFYSPKKK